MPTILFFPAVKNSSLKTPVDRSETRVFPANKPLTVTNLLNFIIVNLPHSSRTQLALNLCDDRCTEVSQNVIKKQLKETNIENQLKPDTLNKKVYSKLNRLSQLSAILLNKQTGDSGKPSKGLYWTNFFDKDEL